MKKKFKVSCLVEGKVSMKLLLNNEKVSVGVSKGKPLYLDQNDFEVNRETITSYLNCSLVAISESEFVPEVSKKIVEENEPTEEVIKSKYPKLELEEFRSEVIQLKKEYKIADKKRQKAILRRVKKLKEILGE